MDKPLVGHCLCGAVTITVAGEHETQIGVCHCRMCQRWTGSAFFCFDASADGVSVRGEVTRFPSSSFAERAFCPACGTHLWFRDTDRPDAKYEFPPGLFDGAHGWGLRSEIYIDRAMASVPLSGAHRRRTADEYEAENQSVADDPS